MAGYLRVATEKEASAAEYSESDYGYPVPGHPQSLNAAENLRPSGAGITALSPQRPLPWAPAFSILFQALLISQRSL